MDENALKFSENHLWIMEAGDIARIGLSDYAQEHLGEIIFVSMRDVDRFLEREETFGDIESQKTVVELASPITGTIRAINELIIEDPTMINIDPYGNGWLIEVELEDPEELENLMSLDEYETFTEE
ncbi:MAG: glycine cleavage system protein GcvH [Syntrophorhabdaceae bacterium]|nr:glycine cleavage system protein GcvH [Syntrophorhabdaceae bacterium]